MVHRDHCWSAPRWRGCRGPLGRLSPTHGRETLIARNEELACYTPVHNPAGCPAMSVPLGRLDGLPVGSHVAARPGADGDLLALAYELEEAEPWADTRPDTAWLTGRDCGPGPQAGRARAHRRRRRDGKVTGWQARWRDPDGRQRKKTLRTKVQAESFLATIRTEMSRGTYVDPVSGRVTVQAWAEQWSAGLVHLKATTQERYRGIVRVHIVPRWGRRHLASVTHGEVASWVAELSDAGLPPGSVRYVHRVFSLMLDVAVRDARIGRNPALGVPMPRPSSREPVFLSLTQVVEFAAAAGAAGPSLRFLAMTGLRFGEFAALRVRRADFARSRLTVAESVTEVGGRLVWSTPKSHQSRPVPLARSLLPDLVEACRGKGPDNLVFTSPTGGTLRIDNWRKRIFDPACERAGLSGVTPHDLRHTAASLAISAGANVKAVQRMLGHASAAMTLDVYAGLFADDADDVAVRLDDLVPSMCPSGPVAAPGGMPLFDSQAVDLR